MKQLQAAAVASEVGADLSKNFQESLHRASGTLEKERKRNHSHNPIAVHPSSLESFGTFPSMLLNLIEIKQVE